ncbi:unnamed protein product, partial [Effrenium voratum]
TLTGACRTAVSRPSGPAMHLNRLLLLLVAPADALLRGGNSGRMAHVEGQSALNLQAPLASELLQLQASSYAPYLGLVLAAVVVPLLLLLSCWFLANQLLSSFDPAMLPARQPPASIGQTESLTKTQTRLPPKTAHLPVEARPSFFRSERKTTTNWQGGR